jgi:hypothetical protein
MTGQQCIDKFHNYVSDKLDSDFELQLVNDAKNALETELQLEITKKLSSSGSTTAGQTYTTSRALPSDFFLPLTIYVGTDPQSPVPFEHQQFYRDSSGRYWIDLANNVYYLAGTQGSAQTIYFYYQYQTTDLTVLTSPVWPTRFHSIIPLEMARLYWQIDQGEKNRAWTIEYQTEYMRWKRLMQDWDAKLKLNAIDNSAFSDTSLNSSENRINF